MDGSALSSLEVGKLDGISTLNNFSISENGITCWKAYGVGEGKTIPWSRLQGMYTDIMATLYQLFIMSRLFDKIWYGFLQFPESWQLLSFNLLSVVVLLLISSHPEKQGYAKTLWKRS